jgi:hypothetical protein
MAMIRRGRPVLALVALLAGGCASTPEVRDLAARTGVFVTSMDDGTAEFIAAQNRLNSENEEHLRTLGRRGETLKARVALQRLASTRAGATTLLETQAAATSVTGAAVVAQLHPQQSQPAAVSFPGGAGYGKAAEALAEIGTKPTALALLRSLVANAGPVREVLSELLEKAKKSGTDTAGETAATAAQAVTAGAAAAANAKEE